MEQKDFITSIIETLSITIDYFQKEIEEYDKSINKNITKLLAPKKTFNQEFLIEEKNLNKMFKENKVFKDELTSKVLKIDEDTKLKIEAFINELNIQGEIQKLIHNENDQYREVWLLKKKKRQELNHKINSLERELAQKIKEASELKVYEEKQYKARIQEELRKLNIDLQRASIATTKSYNEIEKQLLYINDNKGINESKKKIREIRKAGLDEQEKIKIQYYEVIYNLGIDFTNLKLKIEDDIAKTTYDYTVRINILESERLQMELEEKHDNLQHLNEVEKKSHAHLIELKSKENQFKKESYSFLINEEKNLYQTSLLDEKTFFEGLNLLETKSMDFDKKQIEVLKSTLLDPEIVSTHYAEIEKLIVAIIKSMTNLVFDNLEDMVARRFSYYEKIISQLIIATKHQKSVLFENFSKYYEKVTIELNKEIEKEKRTLNDTKTNMENILKVILSSIDSFFKEIDILSEKEKTENNEFVNNLQKIFDECIGVSIDETTNDINNITNITVKKHKELDNFYNEKLSEGSKEIENLNVESKNKLSKIESDIELCLQENKIQKNNFNKQKETIISELLVKQKEMKLQLQKEVERELQKLEATKKEEIKAAKVETNQKKKTL